MDFKTFHYLLPILLIFMSSCKDKEVQPESVYNNDSVEQANEQEGNILEAINGETELSHFAMVLGAKKLPELRTEQKKVTIFAPVNDVFPPWDGAIDTEYKNEFIYYYIIDGSISTDELRRLAVQDSSSFLYSLNDEKIYLELDGERITLKDSSGQKARIVRSLNASNGIVHVIDNIFSITSTGRE